MNIDDCVKAYEKQIEDQEREAEEADVKQHADTEALTAELMQGAGLDYKSIDGQSVFIEHAGETIHFIVWKSHSYPSFRRVLGKCARCGEQIMTEIMYLEPADIGRAIANPDQSYHFCEAVAQAPKPKPKTAAEKLAEALEKYIDERIAEATNV